ncbi:MAG: hypothetical protein GWO24_12390 [Akkermansiaceae bacterium]|nr:hypothetical protein [Akkermansiaceae bacterium]
MPFEFQGTGPVVPEGEEPEGLAASETFRGLAERQWATQDFLPPTDEEADIYPYETEMKALRAGGMILKVGAALIALYLGWSGVRAFQIMRDPAWHRAPGKGGGGGNTVLATQIKRYEQWNSFLADRSKAWVTMELMNQLFPNPNSVVLSDAKHTVRPELAQGQTRASLVKDWAINGYVNDEALEHLTVINTKEGINRVFQSVYELTGDESLRTDLESRSLVVNLLASENKRYKPNSGSDSAFQFPFVFNLTVSQRIASEDPLAIPTSAAP